MTLHRVGVIGLGLMGTAISERLLAGGYSLAVWNRTRQKAEAAGFGDADNSAIIRAYQE